MEASNKNVQKTYYSKCLQILRITHLKIKKKTEKIILNTTQKSKNKKKNYLRRPQIKKFQEKIIVIIKTY